MGDRRERLLTCFFVMCPTYARATTAPLAARRSPLPPLQIHDDIWHRIGEKKTLDQYAQVGNGICFASP